MQLETKKLLEDVARALELLERFSRGRKLEEYKSDPMLRSAVERQFEIVGEVRKQLADRDPATASAIPELRRIVGFRNILIHGYALVKDELVWGVLTDHVASLRFAVQSLLARPSKS